MPFPFVGKSPVEGNDIHFHPQNNQQYTFGKLRRSPETVKRGDVFAADSGRWESCPPEWIGQDVGDFTSTMIVCPAKEY